jgi:DNA (cytosine-5)-methyltransferase 1
LKKENKKTLYFIDLFAGIGGFRIAMESAGAKCVFSSEIDSSASETYRVNFHEQPDGDITKIDSKKIPNHDILCAGFPCQPFSLGGYRKGFEDTRGTMFFEIERILTDKKPKAFILENVTGILSHNKKNTIEVIRKKLKKKGYVIFEKILDAKDFDLPQNRRRWFCVGFRKDLKIDTFDFPTGKGLTKSVYDLLEKNVIGHEITKIAAKHIKFHYNNFKKSSSSMTIASEVRPSRCSMRDDGLVPCLTAKMGTGGNNVPIVVEQGRKLTVNECLQLMGFNQDFQMKENYHQSYKQIGNSIVVPIVSSIADKVIKKIT